MSRSLAALGSLPWVAGTRRCGIMAGIDITDAGRPFPPDAFVGSVVSAAARAHGVIMRPLGDTLVWMPPLTTLHCPQFTGSGGWVPSAFRKARRARL